MWYRAMGGGVLIERYRGCCLSLFGAVGRQTPHGGDVALGDGIVVKVLETLHAEHMTTVQHPVAHNPFLGL